MVNTEIRLITFFAAKDGETLYSQQKQDWEVTVGQEDCLEEGMATHSRILPGESHGQRSLVGYSP